MKETNKVRRRANSIDLCNSKERKKEKTLIDIKKKITSNTWTIDPFLILTSDNVFTQR